MSTTEKLITLVIHTPERAGILKGILESHGMKVELEDFVVSHSTIRVAERVKISEEDLPLALKILESGDNYCAASMAMKMAGMSGNLLIPVDFSDSSMLAVKMGFNLARRLSVHPVLMHAFMAPLFASSPFGSADLSPIAADPDVTTEEVVEISDIRQAAEAAMHKFKKRISNAMSEGKIPEMEYSSLLMEGIAEEVILNYCRETPPMLVVMATRGIERKEEELVGSVTAEVLDSCRVPVLTVPDICEPLNIKDINKLLVFCNVDQQDILAMEVLMRMFDYPACDIAIVPVTEKKRTSKVTSRIDELVSYFNKTYPNSSFRTIFPEVSDFRKGIDAIIKEQGIQLMIVPNKKTNVFSRIFHPTIAHKFLFERDMLMLALPI